MRVFNSIQIVVLLMLAPTLLQLVRTATFAGAGAVFWVGLIGTFALAIFTMVSVHDGIER